MSNTDTNQENQGKINISNKEIVNQAMQLIRHDIALNKDLSEFDFSFFLGNVLNVTREILVKISKETRISYHKKGNDFRILIKCIDEVKASREALFAVSSAIMRVVETMDKQKVYGEIYFPNTSKAISIIGRLRHGEIDVAAILIKKFLDELLTTTTSEDMEANDTAFKIFLQ